MIFASVIFCLFLFWNRGYCATRHNVKETSKFHICSGQYPNASKWRDNIICTNSYQYGEYGSPYPMYCPDKPCACYFEVKGATDRANTDLRNGKYRFSLDTARKICDEYNATLPTIHDYNEHMALKVFLANCEIETFRKKCDKDCILIALGMTKAKGKPDVAEWDDGVSLPDEWEIPEYLWRNGDESYDWTFTVSLTTADGPRKQSQVWQTFREGEPTDKVYVLCKHELTGNRVETQAPTTTSVTFSTEEPTSPLPTTQMVQNGCGKVEFSLATMSIIAVVALALHLLVPTCK